MGLSTNFFSCKIKPHPFHNLKSAVNFESFKDSKVDFLLSFNDNKGCIIIRTFRGWPVWPECYQCTNWLCLNPLPFWAPLVTLPSFTFVRPALAFHYTFGLMTSFGFQLFCASPQLHLTSLLPLFLSSFRTLASALPASPLIYSPIFWAFLSFIFVFRVLSVCVCFSPPIVQLGLE